MDNFISRRTLLAACAGTSLVGAQSKTIPVGLELFSVRDELNKDLFATVTAVAKLGYEIVEFYSPYFGWTVDYARQVRTLLDDLAIECRSLHSPRRAFEADGRAKAIELNKILGSTSVVMASRVEGSRTPTAGRASPHFSAKPINSSRQQASELATTTINSSGKQSMAIGMEWTFSPPVRPMA